MFLIEWSVVCFVHSKEDLIYQLGFDNATWQFLPVFDWSVRERVDPRMFDCTRFKDFLRMSSCVALCSCEKIFLPNIDIAYIYIISPLLFPDMVYIYIISPLLFPDMVYIYIISPLLFPDMV